ncbi:MAG: type II toxin-antitoxin system ParD family antitoxin, partial [Desulfobacterales bacterium]|nr:type II toxin-antitoxin system ParD family antitoxin [Desulfobacterales bacterium]
CDWCSFKSALGFLMNAFSVLRWNGIEYPGCRSFHSLNLGCYEFPFQGNQFLKLPTVYNSAKLTQRKKRDKIAVVDIEKRYGANMGNKISINLGNHFDSFIAQQIESGRYSSVSEVIRAGLRMLEKNETKVKTLRSLLEEGEKSGFIEYSYEKLISSLDQEGG